MKQIGTRISMLLVLLCSLYGQAQQTVATNTSVTVPPLVNFSGTLTDVNGKPVSGTVGVTFLLYKESQGGSPLWLETQNVQPDNTGHYTVMLGSTSSTGLPSDIFVAGEAHWLGVQMQGQQQEEQPRVLLVSAPYALKAGDAETIGGLPPSAFVLAADAGSNKNGSAPTASKGTASGGKSSAPANADVTGAGTVGFIPIWNTTSDIVDSAIFQKSSNIGIGTVTPAAALDVGGKTDLRDMLTLFPKGADNNLEVSGTTFKIGSTGLITFVAGQTFPGAGTITGVTTATGSGLSGGGKSGTLSLKVPAAGITNAMLQNSALTLNANAAGGLTTPGAMTLGNTYTIGLKPCATNQVLQYSGSVWNCSSAGTGTITGVTAGSDLTGGGTSGSVTLNLDTTKVPLLSAANTFVGNQSITGNLTATGSISAQTASLNANGTTTALSVNQLGGGVGLGVSATTGYGISSIAQFIGVEGASTAAGGYGVAGLSTSGYAVYGVDNAPTGTSVGVYGETESSAGYGVEGSALNVGVYGSGTGTTGYGVDGHGTYMGVKGIGTATSGTSIGVYGQTSDTEGFGVQGASPNIGVYGTSAGSSNTGVGFGITAGVWGDTGGSPGATFTGVYGTADDNVAGLFINDTGSETGTPTVAITNLTSTKGGLVLSTYSGIGDGCTIDTEADLTCTGTVKGAVQIDGGARKVSLYAMQSAENWFEDAGSGQLSSGSASIALDPTFAQTVNLGVDYHVFLTPNGDCKGLYVSQKSATSFEVHELGGGNSSVAFDYRIMAKRSGYENPRLADVTEQYQKIAQQHLLRQQRMQQRRASQPAEGPVAAVVAAPRKPTVEVVAHTVSAPK
jgi:hypothetical protein